MKTLRFVLFTISMLMGYHYTSAETITATFDFSSNNYGLPECPNIGEIGSSEYVIKSETVISNNGVSIILAPSPYKASTKYVANWRGDLNALYYNNLSHFTIKTTESGAMLNNVTITFANGMNGNTSYFYNTYTQDKVRLNNYTLTGDIGTLDLSSTKYSEIHWFNSTDKKELQIKKIEVTYIIDTSALNNAYNNGYKIIANNGTIKVFGDYNTIEVYNISGAMISQNKSIIECPMGIYIVKVNDVAQKVVVR